MLVDSALDVLFKEKDDELFRFSIPDIGKLLITLLNFFRYNFRTDTHGNLANFIFFQFFFKISKLADNLTDKFPFSRHIQ